MEAQKNSKMTVKSLHQEFNILKEGLLKNLKDKIEVLEKRLDESETKVKVLEEKLTPKQESFVKKCKKCDKSFDSERNLKSHVLENHPQSIKCSSCIQTFNKNHELEYHIKTCHENYNEYECGKCKKKFILEWRLKKHMKNYDQPASLMKKCHFYNNESCGALRAPCTLTNTDFAKIIWE